MLKLLVIAASLSATIQAAPDPADEAQIDRLLEVVPHSRADRERAPDPQHLADVEALNPGRGEEVRQLLEAEARCESTVVGSSLRNAFREMGRRLGRAKIDRLIAFYSGVDFRTFTSIEDRSGRGEPISTADRETMERIMRDYPLIEMASLLTSGELMPSGTPNMFESFEQCLIDTNAAFARAGLRRQPDHSD